MGQGKPWKGLRKLEKGLGYSRYPERHAEPNSKIRPGEFFLVVFFLFMSFYLARFHDEPYWKLSPIVEPPKNYEYKYRIKLDLTCRYPNNAARTRTMELDDATFFFVLSSPWDGVSIIPRWEQSGMDETIPPSQGSLFSSAWTLRLL
jgi:hypothetical protein